jgi:hypothetical protein
LKNDPKITDHRLTDKPLIEILNETGTKSHPSIIQCICPGCLRHFKNHDLFKQHLSENHEVGQDEINNFEIFALMLLYENSEKYYVKGHSRKYPRVLQYWQKKRRFLFQHCNFPHIDSLNMGFRYVSYFMKRILHFNFVTDTQIRVIDALSPIWKVLLMNRLYHIVD